MRQGKKSAAQTKAPLKDRIKGSKINKKGSASSTAKAKDIVLSSEIISALMQKAIDFNKINKDNKVSLSTLKAVFRRGAGAFSTSHRPNMTRNEWAYARVNKFLEKKAGEPVKKAYVQDDDLMEKGGKVDVDYTKNALKFFKKELGIKSDVVLVQSNFTFDPKTMSQTTGHATAKRGNKFYLGINLNESKNRFIRTLAHELVHIKQMEDNRLKFNGNTIIFDDEKMTYNEYLEKYHSDDIPKFEDEAFTQERELQNKYAEHEKSYNKGGNLGQEITCHNCGWQWNTKDSDDSDKYVCHKCGFDNTLFYSNDIMAEGGLIAPNGSLSNLTPEQYKLVRTPEFKAWFGDWENDPQNASKVVDENGEPMVCYHRTDKKFTTFDKEKLGQQSGWATAYFGFYFSNKNNRGSYGKKIMKCFLNIRNPYFIQTETYSDFDYDYKRFDPSNFKNNDGIYIKADRLVLDEKADKHFVAFEPNQIKLADGINTTFDMNNPDIRYKQGGQLKPAKSLLQIAKEKKVTITYAFEQLKKGMEFEKEHSDDKKVQKTIALQHLDENIDYYKKLAKMESTFEQGGEITSNLLKVGDKVKLRRLPIYYRSGDIGRQRESIKVIKKIRLVKEENVDPLKYKGVSKITEIYVDTKDNQRISFTFFDNDLVRADSDNARYEPVYEDGGYLEKGGEVDADNPKIKNEMIHKSGKVGGLLVGKRHSEGGIKAINKSNNSPLEMEGGEVVITRNAVSDDTKREFEGEMLTNREILSKINEGGGGVSFAKGGDVPEHIMVSGKTYKYGGKTLKDSDIVDYCGCKHKLADGGTTESMVFKGYEIGDDGTYRKPSIKNFGVKHPELKPSEAFVKIYGHKYKKGGRVESIVLIDKSVPSYNDFKNNNKSINLHITKSEYKKYLKNNYKVDFDHLPNTIRMGLLLGNQKLVDKYINA